MLDRAAYTKFLESKVVVAPETGFDNFDGANLHPSALPHQRDMIAWALRNGHGLIAASFGLGKTHVQIEIARAIVERTGQRFLIVCPLGVKHQFQKEDGPRLGVSWQYVRTDDEIDAADSPFIITNYERVRDGDIDPRKHSIAGVSLDEGSVMRSLGSKTYQVFQDLFAGVRYRFVATATPSPNQYRELIYYAEWLGVMDHGQALTRWFKRDPAKAGNLQLHTSHEEDFWKWVSTWALFLHTPSDLGYDDTGYALPELRVHWHRIPVDHTRAWEQHDNRGQGLLLLDPTLSATGAAKEKRATLDARIEKMLEIMRSEPPDTHWLLWHHLEDERRAIQKALPEVSAVYGSQDLDVKEQTLLDFTHGIVPVLATKPELAGFGCNFQYHCSKAIYLGIDYKAEDFLQSLHRIFRFQQDEPVDIHIIYAESEDKVAATLRDKWQRHDELQAKMRDIVQAYGLSHAAIENSLRRQIGTTRQEVRGERFTAVCNDSVMELPGLAGDSIGLIHTSIPFGNHYEYTTQYEDFGHNPTDENFFVQMDYLIPELFRVLKPGRAAVIHVKDRILYGHQTKSGLMEVSPFSDDTTRAFRKHGFLYEGRVTITTDVVRENNSTYRLGWTEMTKDSSKMGHGLPEYLLLFRKPPTSTDTARADEPVTHDKAEYTRARWQIDAHAYWRSNGNRLVSRELYNYCEHVRRLETLEAKGNLPASFFVEPPASTSPYVWDDIVSMRCLNSDQSRRKVENHICPLPLDIVERVIELRSNPGDIVLDPFAGLFTVPYMAIKLGRIGYGIELSPPYFGDGVGYCQDIERQVLAPTLFDLITEDSNVAGSTD